MFLFLPRNMAESPWDFPMGWLMVNLSSTRTPRSLSAELSFIPWSILLLSQQRMLQSSSVNLCWVEVRSTFDTGLCSWQLFFFFDITVPVTKLSNVLLPAQVLLLQEEVSSWLIPILFLWLLVKNTTDTCRGVKALAFCIGGWIHLAQSRKLKCRCLQFPSELWGLQRHSVYRWVNL